MTSTFAARMRLAADDSGLSAQQIAEAAGTTKGQVSQWRKDGSVQVENVKADVVERICQVLKVRPRWLLYNEPPMRWPTDNAQSQLARFDDATMSQAFDLLYLIADHRPDDVRFSRLTWHMVQVAAKAIERAEAGANQRSVIAQILAEI
jgi:transcriptional regulator with XRE-family HTH domain